MQGAGTGGRSRGVVDFKSSPQVDFLRIIGPLVPPASKDEESLAETYVKRALDIHKRALDIHKRALYIHKRALYILNGVLHVPKRALHIPRRALDILKKTLYKFKRYVYLLHRVCARPAITLEPVFY